MRTTIILAACVFLPGTIFAQGRGPQTSKSTAPEDLTGQWVSLITEDWRFRMVTPSEGDYASVPSSTVGRKLADNWDPAKDEADGLQCKAYGAPAIMRMPTRVRVSWTDDETLKFETDAGTSPRPGAFPYAGEGRSSKAQR